MAQKRGNGEGSIGQYHGRWIARFSLADGRRKAVYGATRAEVAQKLAAATRDRDIGLPTLNEQTTLGDFLARWLEQSVKPRNRPSTVKSYTTHVRVHLAPALGSVRLARLTPSDVERFMAGKLAEGLSASTVTRIRATLRRSLALAQKQGLVARNSAALADPPHAQPKRYESLTIEQARAFLEAVRGHRLEALFAVAIATGLRQGELLGLQWTDVDLDGKRLFVRHALQRVDGVPTLVEPKTPRSRRTIALPLLALAQLRAQLERRSVALADDGEWNPLALVFTSMDGTPLDGPNVTHALQRLLREAGLPHLRFHDLRHTCASLLLAQGANMRVIMEQLGHTQISLTMNTYSHVMPEAMQDAAERMERILTGAPADAVD